jgi:hypothetical protein
MSLAKINHQSQPGHPSRMPLAKANHQSHPDHPSLMRLVEANQQLNQSLIIDLTFINDLIHIS